jgi:hypothetical protein
VTQLALQWLAAAASHDGYGVPAWRWALAGLAWVAYFQALGVLCWGLLWRWPGASAGAPRHAALPATLVLFFQQVLGLGGSMLLLLLAALLGLFSLPGVLGLGLAALAVLGAVAWHGRDRAGAIPRTRLTPWEVLVLLAATLVMGLASWRYPGYWDDTAYHLPLARTVLEQQSLVANEWLRFPYFPAYLQLLFAGGLLQGATLAQWLATWPAVLTLIGLMGAAALSARHAFWGVLAWLVYAHTPFVESTLGFAYVDAGLALFCMAAVLAAAMWAGHIGPAWRTRWLLLSAGCMGIAGGIKFQGLVCGAAIGLMVLLFSLPSARAAVRNAVLYAGVVLAVCGFWYARSYALTGDPIHPAGGRWFGYYLWTAADLAGQVAEQATHGLPKAWSNFIDSLGVAQAGMVWAALLYPMPRQNRARPALVVWGVMLVLVLFWFWVSQVERYLMPALPLAALLTATLASQVWRLTRLSPLWLLAPTLAAMVMLPWDDFMQLRPPIAVQRQARPERQLLHQASQLAKRHDARLLQVGYENAFFDYSGQLVGDWFGRAPYRDFLDCGNDSGRCRMRPAAELARAMRALDASLLLINSERFPFDVADYDAHLQRLGQNGPAYLYALPPEPR